VPIYEYRCQRCDADFERLVRSPNERVKCPECAGRRVRRKLSTFAVSGSSQDRRSRSAESSCGSCRAASCAGCRR